MSQPLLRRKHKTAASFMINARFVPLTPNGKLVNRPAQYVANGGTITWGINIPQFKKFRVECYTRYLFELYDEENHKYTMSIKRFMQMIKTVPIINGHVWGTFIAIKQRVRYSVRYVCPERLEGISITPKGWAVLDLGSKPGDLNTYRDLKDLESSVSSGDIHHTGLLRPPGLR